MQNDWMLLEGICTACAAAKQYHTYMHNLQCLAQTIESVQCASCVTRQDVMGMNIQQDERTMMEVNMSSG